MDSVISIYNLKLNHYLTKKLPISFIVLDAVTFTAIDNLNYLQQALVESLWTQIRLLDMDQLEPGPYCLEVNL